MSSLTFHTIAFFKRLLRSSAAVAHYIGVKRLQIGLVHVWLGEVRSVCVVFCWACPCIFVSAG